MKILGLDVSLTSTGYCIINNGRLVKSSLGTITPPTKDSIGKRLQYFAEELTVLLEKHKPDFVVVEDIYRGPSVKVFKILAMIRGVCFKIVFDKINKDPISIMPTEARKLAKVGGTKKEDGFGFAVKKFRLLKYEFDTHNDITDAIILALAYHELQKLGLEKEYFKPKKKKRKRKSSKK